MISIETEKDIERLRQMARILACENELLHRRLRELTAALASAQGADRPQLELELRILQEQLARRNQELFGKSSEKRPHAPDAATDTETPEAQPAKPARRGHGPRPQPQLPVVTQIHLLDKPDQICPRCGETLPRMEGQFEESDEIDVVERQFHIVRHKRQKYGCRCGSCVETALAPTKLIPGGRYSTNVAVAVAVAKYADHLPLARQVKQMARAGLVVDTQTLWDQLWALHGVLVPSYEAVYAHQMRKGVLGADESTWPLLETGKPTDWWIWALTSDDAVFYQVFRSRGHESAEQLLATFHGVLMVDGYGAYTALQNKLLRRAAQPDLPLGAEVAAAPAFLLAFCWAHVRRKWVECEPHYPQAREILDLIGELYAVERQVAGAPPAQRLELCARLRRDCSTATVARIRTWADAQRAVPRTAFGNALGYMTERWNGLVRFLEDPSVPIDNNFTEREMRAPVVGRKNHYGSRSERGTRVAALFYTLVESARLSGIEPSRYLAEATRRALANPGTATIPLQLLKELPAPPG